MKKSQKGCFILFHCNFLVRNFSEIFMCQVLKLPWPNQPPRLSHFSRSRRANLDDLHGDHLDDTSDTPGGVLGWKGDVVLVTSHPFTKRHNWVGLDFSGTSSPNMMEDSVSFLGGGFGGQLIRGASICKILKATKGQSLMKI